jgi:L-threonylcarbamoyladenylate synthase
MDDVAEAARVLRAGGLVALPTETVYGLGADASNREAVAKIFRVKGRPQDHPLIVHIADAAAIDGWATDVSPLARALATALWPGPLTLVLKKQSHVDDALTGGQPTIGLRVPAHPLALALLRTLAPTGIAAPSANRFGRVSPTSAQHVRDDLGDLVDYVLDGGPCAIGLESTIVDLSRGDDDAVVLRPGGVGPEALAKIAGRPNPLRASAEVRVPGQHASHYAPRARLVVIEPDALDEVLRSMPDERVGSIVTGTEPGEPQWRRDGRGWRVVLAPGAGELAHHLYAVLRELDARGCTVIVATFSAVQHTDLAPAIADRLRRAATPGDRSA